MEALTLWACFLSLRGQLTFLLLISLCYFGGFSVWVDFQLDGDRSMSPKFQKGNTSSTVANHQQIGFSAAFDSVNRQVILSMLCYVGIGGSMLLI